MKKSFDSEMIAAPRLGRMWKNEFASFERLSSNESQVKKKQLTLNEWNELNKTN